MGGWRGNHIFDVFGDDGIAGRWGVFLLMFTVPRPFGCRWQNIFVATTQRCTIKDKT